MARGARTLRALLRQVLPPRGPLGSDVNFERGALAAMCQAAWSRVQRERAVKRIRATRRGLAGRLARVGLQCTYAGDPACNHVLPED